MAGYSPGKGRADTRKENSKDSIGIDIKNDPQRIKLLWASCALEHFS